MRIVAIAVLALALAGCAAPEGSDPSDPGSAGDFRGPWAETFQLTYDQATSDDERAALADGEITAQEYAYFQDRIVQCLSGLGVDGQFRSNGDLEYSNPQQVSQDAITACNADNGIRVIILHDAIAQNPTNVDQNQLVVDCLVNAGVVDGDYSVDDLQNGVDVEVIGQTEEFAGCVNDPYQYGR